MNLEEIQEDDILTDAHFFAVRSDGLAFMKCVQECSETPEMIAEIDRLYGTNLQRKGSPIELAIDDATGKRKSDVETFLRFVWNCVFIRVPSVR